MYGYLFLRIHQNTSPPFPEVGSERQAMKGKEETYKGSIITPQDWKKRTRRGNEKPAVKVAVPEEWKIVCPVLVTEIVTRVTILLIPLERSLLYLCHHLNLEKYRNVK